MESKGIVSIVDSFSAAHRLLGYDGCCAKLHGHNYRVKIKVEYSHLKMGLSVDFKDLKECLKKCLDMYDHKTVLNEGDGLVDILIREKQDVVVVSTANPTAETFAALIFKYLDLDIRGKFSAVLYSVEVEETDNCSATVTRQ